MRFIIRVRSQWRQGQMAAAVVAFVVGVVVMAATPALAKFKVAPKTLNLGSVETGATGTFTISNTGINEAITVTVGQPSGTCFSVAPSGTFSVGVNSSVTETVTVITTTLGQCSATILVSKPHKHVTVKVTADVTSVPTGTPTATKTATPTATATSSGSPTATATSTGSATATATATNTATPTATSTPHGKPPNNPIPIL